MATNPHQRRNRKFPGKSLSSKGGANQTDAPGLEINAIVAQYRKHGTLPKVTLNNPLYGDFTFPEDIHSVREAVEKAEDRFDNLPASVRSAAENDWVTFLEMIQNDEQKQVLIDAGLEIVENTPPIPDENTPPVTNTPPPSETPPEEPPSPPQ